MNGAGMEHSRGLEKWVKGFLGGIYQRDGHGKYPGFFLLPRTESKEKIQVQP